MTQLLEDQGTQPQVREVLSSLVNHLGESLSTLESLGPLLKSTLHDETQLPDGESAKTAALAVDLLHKLQLLLDTPVNILTDHFLGYVKSKGLVAVVQQDVPDALNDHPMTLSELADVTKSEDTRLGQIMRLLCNQGIFSYDESTRRYANTAASSLLRSKHWTQWHNWATLYGNQFYDIARGIPESVRAGTTRSAAQINYDTDQDMFTFFRQQGWVPELHRTLGGGATAQMPGILQDYPWHEVSNGLVMDIGGGSGAFLASLLRQFPTMRGGLFDLPHIIDLARLSFRKGGQFEEVEHQILDESLVAGDFFESVPSSPVYTMKWCLHDWKDDQVVRILKNIHNSILPGPSSRLVVLESILADGHSNRLSQYGDINMMMTTNGQERTAEQWKAVAELSGWRIEKTCDLRRAWVKAMDFRPV